jgi:hypothetical protein
MKPCKELDIGDNLPKLKVEDTADSLDLVPEPCKKPVEQNAFTCFGPGAFCVDQGTLNASHAACTTQVGYLCAVFFGCLSTNFEP